MASVVDTSVKWAHSGQIGSMVLTGAPGSKVALLRAFLVDGWGLKSVDSLVTSSGVATITVTGTHPAQVDTVILVEGVTGALTALNGEQKVTAVTGSTISFATAAANGTAAGSITTKMAPAGWSMPFSATNVGVFRSDDVTSNRRFVRIADTATHRSRIHVYENMTTVSSGTGPMPTSAQVSGGAHLPKLSDGFTTSLTSNWAIFANGKRVFVFVAPYSSQGAAYTGGLLYGWGDFPSLKPGDVYNTFLAAGADSNFSYNLGLSDWYEGWPGLWIQRLHTAAANARPGGKLMSAIEIFTGKYAGSGPLGPFPSVVGGGLILAPSWLFADVVGTYGLRGPLPGLWQSPQTVAPGQFAHGDIVPGVGVTAGRRLFAVHAVPGAGATSPSPGGTFIDITGPWPGD